MDTIAMMVIYLVLILLTGMAVVNLIYKNREAQPLLKWPLAYGLGIMVCALWMLALSFLNIRFTRGVLLIPTLLAAVSLIYSLQKTMNTRSGQSRHVGAGIGWPALLLTGFVGLFLVYVFWNAVNTPIHAWDEVERIAHKAKHFVYDASIRNAKHLPHPSYPLLFELIITWTALVFGQWSEALIKCIFPLTLISYVFLQTAFLKSVTNLKWALAGAALLLTAPLLIHQATLAYVDLPLMFFNCSAILLMLMWSDCKEDECLWMAGLMAGAAGFCKLEGIFYFVPYVAVLLYLLSRRGDITKSEKYRKALKFVLPGVAVLFAFLIYKGLNDIPLTERIGYDFSFKNFSRIPVVCGAYIKNLFLSGNWGLIWIVFVVSLIRLDKIKSVYQIRAAVLCLVLFFGIHFSQFLLTPNYYWISHDLAYGVLARLTLHFMPLAAVLIVLLNYPKTD